MNICSATKKETGRNYKRGRKYRANLHFPLFINTKKISWSVCESGKKEKEKKRRTRNGIDEEARNRFDFSGTSVFGICIRILGQRFKRNRHSPQKKKVWSSSSLATRVNWMFSSLRITNMWKMETRKESSICIFIYHRWKSIEEYGRGVGEEEGETGYDSLFLWYWTENIKFPCKFLL